MSSNAPYQNIGILSKNDSPHCLNVLRKLVPYLKRYHTQYPNSRFSIDRSIKFNLPPQFKHLSAAQVAKTSDLLLSIGGDGTLLRSARLLVEAENWKSSFLLGINAGRLGFLTFLNQENLGKSIDRILGQKMPASSELRTCLEVNVKRNAKIWKRETFLNDAVIKNGALSRLIEYQVSLDGNFLSSYRADGLIVSTPTGSTAYNLAAGGAILEPLIPALQLAPICAQSFSNKPIVVGDHHEVQIQLSKNTIDAFLTLDGHTGIKLNASDKILIKKSKRSINLLLPETESSEHYLLSLRQKLKWGLVSPSSS